MHSVKLIIMSSGALQLTHPKAKRGYGGSNPVIEIIGVPDATPDSEVLRTYGRGIYLPIMHADKAIHWSRIRGIEQGQIVRLTPGRPVKSDEEKSVKINITLSPEALALIDAQEGARSTLIEGLIRDRWESEA